MDPFQVVMMSQYIGRNISILYGNGEKWSADPDLIDDIVLVYKGENEFLPTDVGTYILQTINASICVNKWLLQCAELKIIVFFA